MLLQMLYLEIKLANASNLANSRKRKKQRGHNDGGRWRQPSVIPSTKCTSMKWRFFSQKKHVKFGRMIKRDLFKVCSIASYTFFSSFEQFVDTTPVKIFPFCREPFIEPFFHIFVRTKALLSKCVTYRCKQMVIGKSQVWWVSRTG